MMLSSPALPPSRFDTWSALQRPRPASANDAQLLLLLSALDAGWRVEEPVYLRSMMGERSQKAYHLILHRPGHVVNLVTVPQSREADAFVQREGWQVLATGY